MKTGLIPLLTLALLACQPAAPEADRAEPQGRAETQGIRNTEAVGYAGNAMADKVDAALDAAEQRKTELDAAMKDEGAP